MNEKIKLTLGMPKAEIKIEDSINFNHNLSKELKGNLLDLVRTYRSGGVSDLEIREILKKFIQNYDPKKDVSAIDGKSLADIERQVERQIKKGEGAISDDKEKKPGKPN